MARFLLVPGLLGGFLFLFWLWAFIDVILTDSILIRNMSKGTWLFVVLIVPTIGAVAWVFFGRPEGAAINPGGQAPSSGNPYRSKSAPVGPEDTPGWSRPMSMPSRPTQAEDGEPLAIRERKLLEREAELAKREAELVDRETDSSPGPHDDEDDSPTNA